MRLTAMSHDDNGDKGKKLPLRERVLSLSLKATKVVINDRLTMKDF